MEPKEYKELQESSTLESQYNFNLKKVNVESTFYTKTPETKKHLGIIGKVRVTPLGYDIRSLSEEEVLKEIQDYQQDWLKMYTEIQKLQKTIRQLFSDMGEL